MLHTDLLPLHWSASLCSGPLLSVPVSSGLCCAGLLRSAPGRHLQCFKTSLEAFSDPTAGLGAFAVGSWGTSPVLAFPGYNCLSSQLGQNLNEGRSYGYADFVISKALSTDIVPNLWWALNKY